jgi:hypothetical protein
VTSLLKALTQSALVALALGSTAPAAAQDALAQFRFMSYVLRDQAPSVAEAKAFAAAKDKQAKLDEYVESWMASSAFDARLERHFHDMFGIEPYVFVAEPVFDLHRLGDADAEEAPGDLVEAGAYYLKSSVKNSCGGTPVNATAWWTTDTIRICPSAVSASLTQAGNWCADPFGANGIRHADCGCGPDQVLCWPKSARGKLQIGVVKEFAKRGHYAYEHGKSWEDLFGGDLFIGNKWLYHHYVYQQRIQVSAQAPTAAELALMRSLPDTDIEEAVFPAGGPERSGVVTSPAFLRRYNNFRSRIRAITEQLLCQDIDGSLNTSGIDHFVNDDLSDFDKSHGEQESCATCHFALDNMGSTILNWGDGGGFMAWWERSQAGHVFGNDGEGPRFLMQSFVQRGDPFTQCMAQKTWEGFSGAKWSDLSSAQKTTFLAAAEQGPRQVIRTVLTSDAMRGLRAANDTVVTKTVTVTYDFDDDVNPILERSCYGAGCHGAGGTGGTYIGNEAAFKGADASRIQNGSMPPQGSGLSLTQAERDILVLYLGQD